MQSVKQCSSTRRRANARARRRHAGRQDGTQAAVFVEREGVWAPRRDRGWFCRGRHWSSYAVVSSKSGRGVATVCAVSVRLVDAAPRCEWFGEGSRSPCGFRQGLTAKQRRVGTPRRDQIPKGVSLVMGDDDLAGWMTGGAKRDLPAQNRRASADMPVGVPLR